MNMLKLATQAVSRSTLALSRTAQRLKPTLIPVLERALESAAHVLCVQSRGVMVCGHSAASVAHFPTQSKTF